MSNKPVMEYRVPSALSPVTEARYVWNLARNRAISPRQFFVFYCLLVVVSLSMALFWAHLGVWPVLPLAGMELSIVGVLFLFYAQHAMDSDRIELSSSGNLLVEQIDGRSVSRVELNARWARIELQDDANPKIEIRYSGKCLLVGSHVSLSRRVGVLDELRRLIRETVTC